MTICITCGQSMIGSHDHTQPHKEMETFSFRVTEGTVMIAAHCLDDALGEAKDSLDEVMFDYSIELEK